MTPVQMNVRIDRDLKREGDQAFAEIGYTPTEVVREVWGFASRNRHKRRVLADMVNALKDPHELAEENAAEQRRLAEFKELLGKGRRQIEKICEQGGIELSSLAPLGDGGYDALLSDAYDEEIERMWGGA